MTFRQIGAWQPISPTNGLPCFFKRRGAIAQAIGRIVHSVNLITSCPVKHFFATAFTTSRGELFFNLLDFSFQIIKN